VAPLEASSLFGNLWRVYRNPRGLTRVNSLKVLDVQNVGGGKPRSREGPPYFTGHF
jgi:hypothetical protein